MSEEMAEMMTYSTSRELDKLFEALGAAQAVMGGAKKDSLNPHFQSKYADLAAVWDACREPLAANGLSVIQLPSADGPKVTIRTILAHKTGQWIASDLTLVSVKSDPQGIGSAITYGRRYGLSAMVGIAPEDDDGNAASGSKKGESESSKKPATPIQLQVATSMLNTIKGMKAEIGEELYYACLKKHGITKFGDIKGADQARQLLNELGEINKEVVAASHGEVAKGTSQLIFESLPEDSRGKIFTELRNKIALACGSQDTALDEYERLSKKCQSQWELYNALDKVHEFYITGKIAG